MRHVLSLDLGIMTGFAVFDRDMTEDVYLVEYGDIQEDDLDHKLGFLLLEYMPRWSVCEMPLVFRGQLGNRLIALKNIVRHRLDHQVVEIEAPQWKNSPFKTYPTPRGTSTHVKDAIRLGAWYCNQLENIS